VRDLLLDRDPDGMDLDLTTDARPDDIERAVRGWADAVWTQGQALRHDRLPQGGA
jgi:poly(A) polymerase